MKATLFTGKCLTEAQLLALAENALPPREAAPLKAHVEQCPLCTDALEGVRFMQDPEQLPPIVAMARGKIQTRITGGIQAPTSIRFLSPQLIGIAASVCLLIGAYLFFQVSEHGDASTSSALSMEKKSSQEMPPRQQDTAISSEGGSGMVQQNLALKENSQAKGKQGKGLLAQEMPDKDKSTATQSEVYPLPASESAAWQGGLLGDVKLEEAKDVLAQNKPVIEEAVPTMADISEDDMKRSEAGEKKEQATEMQRAKSIPQSAKSLNASAGYGDGGQYPPVQLEIYQSPYLTDDLNQQMASAQKAFNGAKFNEAAVLYEKLLEEAPSCAEANYLAALNYLFQNNANKAVQKFTALSLSATAKDFSDIDWNKVADWVKKGKTSKAEALLAEYHLQKGKLVKR